MGKGYLTKVLSPKREKVLKEIVEKLKPYQAEKIFLFGSYARNESDDLSDIDLVIIKKTEEDFFERIRTVLRLLDLKKGIDVFVYTPLEFQNMQDQGNALIQTVLEEGILLYG